MKPSGSHLLEITTASSAVTKLIRSCYFSISNHSGKTEFPLLNTGRITLGSVDDLSKDFPPSVKWLMAYPSAHKTNVFILNGTYHLQFPNNCIFSPKVKYKTMRISTCKLAFPFSPVEQTWRSLSLVKRSMWLCGRQAMRRSQCSVCGWFPCCLLTAGEGSPSQQAANTTFHYHLVLIT